MDKPNIYQLSKIYKIVCNVTGLCYIGSTTQRLLCQRLLQHIRDYNKWKRGKHNFITSFKILENGNYEIILLDECPCETKDQLHKKERYWIGQNECVNRNIPSRTNQERHKVYQDVNKEQIAKQQNEFSEKNKEIIIKGVSYNEYMRNYRRDKKCVNNVIQPDVIPKTIIKRVTIRSYPDYYNYTRHQKNCRKGLKVMIDRVQWLKWTELFDLVLEEFNEKKYPYIAYHNLD